MFPLYIRQKNANNAIGVFRPMYIYARLHGLFSFTVNLERPFALTKPFVSKVDFCVLVLHLLLYAGFVVLNMCYDVNSNMEIAAVLEVGHRITLTCGISSAMVGVVFDFFNRKNLWKIFQQFEDFDRMV